MKRPNYETMTSQVHVDAGGKTLCNQRGHVTLCAAEDFEQVAELRQCGRCRRLLDDGMKSCVISEQQQRILMEIAQRAEAPDGWVYVMDLPHDRSSSAESSFRQSIRRLAQRGLIERKIDHARAMVRLVAGAELARLRVVKQVDYKGV